MSSGITQEGFIRKTYESIYKDLEEGAKSAFGSQINTNENSFIGLWLRNQAWEIARQWEILEDVYHSSFVGTAEGINLDAVAKYMAIERKPALRGTGELTIESGKLFIPKGTKYSNKDMSVVYEAVYDNDLSPGTNKIKIRSTKKGKNQNVAVDEINTIVSPFEKYVVYNGEAITNARDLETDIEFRERYFRSTQIGGTATRGSIEAMLLDIEGVVDALVIENNTMNIVDGIPPKSIAPFVFEGDDEEVAQVIFNNKAAGIQCYGKEYITIGDGYSDKHLVGITRPEPIMVDVKLIVSKNDESSGDDEIKEAVIRHIGGTYNNTYHDGLGFGENVGISRLIGAVMCNTVGLTDLKVELKTEDEEEYKEANIEIGKIDIALTSAEKVVIDYA